MQWPSHYLFNNMLLITFLIEVGKELAKIEIITSLTLDFFNTNVKYFRHHAFAYFTLPILE